MLIITLATFFLKVFLIGCQKLGLDDEGTVSHLLQSFFTSSTSSIDYMYSTHVDMELSHRALDVI